MSRCKETAGFLFSHPCRHPSTDRCSSCSKPICQKHLRTLDQQVLCISCHKQRNQTSGEWMRHDPYYYSSYHYSDYDDYSDYDRYSVDDREAFEAGGAGAWSEDWEDDYDGS